MTEDSTSEFEQLIDEAADKVSWSRKKALEFLDHANDLEERANTYRKLAASMISEAQEFASEIADLMEAEFPLEDSLPTPPEPGQGTDNVTV